MRYVLGQVLVDACRHKSFEYGVVVLQRQVVIGGGRRMHVALDVAEAAASDWPLPICGRCDSAFLRRAVVGGLRISALYSTYE